MKEELLTVSKEDEAVIVRYLLDIMRTHAVITEEEYQKALYRSC